MCLCGGGFKDAQHYFMSCVYFDDLRLHLSEMLELICYFELNTLLYGSINLSDAENMLVFDAVHKFHMDFKHFE